MFYLFDRKYYIDLFVSQWHFWHFSFLSNYWTSVIWPDIWHTEINFLHWKVVCSHSFLICLDSVRIKYGFLSLSLLLGYYSCSTPVFWRSDMWLTDTKREDLDRLIKWTPWYSTSCNSQSQFSTATIKIALKSTAAYFAAASISYIAATAAAVADHGDHIGVA